MADKRLQDAPAPKNQKNDNETYVLSVTPAVHDAQGSYVLPCGCVSAAEVVWFP
jgi:hypothetical protein